MKTPLLDIQNLCVDFVAGEDVFHAVKNISFSLNSGKTLGIVGESGSGKSVTSLSIVRLLQQPQGKISSGNIFFSEKENESIDFSKISEYEMQKYRGKKIAMIFQEPMTSLNPVHRCGDQVAEVLMLHEGLSKKEAHQRTLSLFLEVKLPRPEEIFRSYPHQLSGGQKQRVMIAMAISCNPAILIADEPTTALDVTVQKTILELLKELQKKYGMSIIFITHDLGVIAEIADKVLVMFRGEIVEQGLIHDIFTHPEHPYTKGLLACRPPLDKRLKVLPTVNDFLNGQNKSVTDFPESLLYSKLERVHYHSIIYKKNPVLQVKGLKTWFPMNKGLFRTSKQYVKAVDNVSFDVFPGETLGLVGESGCGKTTLGRTILRMIKPLSGEVLYKGQNLALASKTELRKLRKHIQIIFQDPYSSLNPRLTVGSVIMEPMKVHKLYSSEKDRKNRALELLLKVGLDEAQFYRYPHELSGGQRQRVCIARALSLNPEFIICDESVSALDVSVQAQVLNLLNDLKREFGFTYIFISHDLSVVKFMSDRMIVMQNGQICEMGDADEIYLNPQSEYTQKLIDAIPKGI